MTPPSGGRAGRIEKWKRRVHELKQEVGALALAMRHPGVPWYAKALAACVVAYALSPIDLIPDFIPVLGLLDDLVLVPLGILAVRALVPEAILAECRAQASTRGFEKRANWIAGGTIAVIWCLVLLAAARWLIRRYR